MGHDVSEPEYRRGHVREFRYDSVALRLVMGKLATLVLLLRSWVAGPFSKSLYA